MARTFGEYRDGCLVSGSEDGTLRLLQPKAPCADVIGRHRDFVTGVCVTDSAVASASYDGTVRLWELPKL
jgi:WD40 repeat protein